MSKNLSNLFSFDEIEEYVKGQKKKKNWIQGAIKHKGQLHKDLGVAEGEDIPEGKIAEAAKRDDKVGQRARLAQTLKKMRKADGLKDYYYTTIGNHAKPGHVISLKPGSGKTSHWALHNHTTGTHHPDTIVDHRLSNMRAPHKVTSVSPVKGEKNLYDVSVEPVEE